MTSSEATHRRAIVAAAAGPPTFNAEPAAIFWLVWGGLWTVLVVCGMAFLFVNREMPFLRIRGLALSFGSVTLLHLYWLSVQIGLAIGQFVPDGAEFWIMGLYLPFGIALFHASNSRFLHIAAAQRRFAGSSITSTTPSPPQPQAKPARCSCRDKTLVGRFRKLDYTSKMLAVVCTGMMLQLLLTVFMYLVSRKYHPWFGIPGTEAKGSPAEQKVEMGRGWEWWPSVFWQFFWAWLVAPVILWKSRGIKDTQGWRVQTIACCVASLHATPMWLVALYVPEMAPVNRYFIPPQWICLSILFIEFFAIFIPCWQVIKHKSLRQETLESIAVWEAKNRARTSRESFITGSTKVGSPSTITDSCKSLAQLEKDTSQTDSIYTMGALEYVLDKNPEPLRKFSALRDFSGENIAFLAAVGEWKSSMPSSAAVKGSSSAFVRERFNRALRIYTEFISPRHAEFQINIASQDLKNLENIFEDAAQILYGDQTERFVDPVVPFEHATWGPPSPTGSAEMGDMSRNESSEAVADRAQYWGEIPDGFKDSVFDDAETSIKYLVLTNTWPKFVKERRYSLDSENSTDTVETCNSSSTLGRVVKYLRAMRG
ncbi:hypothetical protein CTRI78_v008539 [Colletotrichum trifolii]|uniref:RGS domain-containing protein n=1 Tax=Colletotrichum trifolii TaxID=5466 RepID=A0A4R8QTW3_COLTR|nr:hypothetical protein CTRI78_v008539 [Colletotrichum trifolii]